MSDKFDEFLNDLPAHARPFVKLWLPTLQRMGAEKLKAWFGKAETDWAAAYAELVETMDTDQKVAEIRLRRAEWERLNKTNVALIAAQRRILHEMLSKAVLALELV